MFVKVFLGYLKGTDIDSFDNSFTPDETNILVSHVSSIIQWAPDTPPELVPTGFLRNELNGSIIVLLSGNLGKDYHEAISKFYNQIYKTGLKGEDLPIEIMSADDIADIYIPHSLRSMVEAGKSEPFTMKFLGEKIVENKLMKTFCYVQDAENDLQNAIYYTLKF